MADPRGDGARPGRHDRRDLDTGFSHPPSASRARHGIADAGLLAGAPNFGLVLTLVAWGAAVDRWGERAGRADRFDRDDAGRGGFVVRRRLALARADARRQRRDGRLHELGERSARLPGWFPPHRRGLAMGIRQASQPVGIAFASLGPAARRTRDIDRIRIRGSARAARAALLSVRRRRDPPRSAHATAGGTATSNPYRGSRMLARIHLASMLAQRRSSRCRRLGSIWFTVDFGWSPIAAGALIAPAQLLGAVTRIGAGVWSDRVQSRPAAAQAGRGRVHHRDARDRCIRLARVGGPGCAGLRRRQLRERRRQRARVHRGRRTRGRSMVGPSARHSEHRAAPRGCARRACRGCRDSGVFRGCPPRSPWSRWRP